MDTLLHARVRCRAEALELGVRGHVAEISTVLEAVYAFVYYGLLVLCSYGPERGNEHVCLNLEDT